MAYQHHIENARKLINASPFGRAHFEGIEIGNDATSQQWSVNLRQLGPAENKDELGPLHHVANFATEAQARAASVEIRDEFRIGHTIFGQSGYFGPVRAQPALQAAPEAMAAPAMTSAEAPVLAGAQMAENGAQSAPANSAKAALAEELAKLDAERARQRDQAAAVGKVAEANIAEAQQIRRISATPTQTEPQAVASTPAAVAATPTIAPVQTAAPATRPPAPKLFWGRSKQAAATPAPTSAPASAPTQEEIDPTAAATPQAGQPPVETPAVDADADKAKAEAKAAEAKRREKEHAEQAQLASEMGQEPATPGWLDQFAGAMGVAPATALGGLAEQMKTFNSDYCSVAAQLFGARLASPPTFESAPNPHFVLNFADGSTIRDEGNIVRIERDGATPMERAKNTIALGKLKGWDGARSMWFAGSDEFVKACFTEALAQGVNVKVKDGQEKLMAESRAAAEAAGLLANAPAPRTDTTPAPLEKQSDAFADYRRSVNAKATPDRPAQPSGDGRKPYRNYSKPRR